MKKFLSVLCVVAALSILLVGCTNSEISGSTDSADSSSESAADTLSGTLTFAGSSSMAGVMEALCEEFESQNPDVTCTIGIQGSGSAITGLNDGTALVGDLSRNVKESENAEGKFEVVTMALDGIAVVVNPSNDVSDLTTEQIASIFTGEVTNWSEVGGSDGAILVVGREEGSGTRDGFESIVDVEGTCQYGTLLKETGDVVSKVASEEAAIGYISFASVSDEVKAVEVNGVVPTVPTISDSSYVLQRPFVHAYLKGTDNELVLAYLEFLETDVAQQYITEEKLVPVEFWN
jgi:phosphate transport system substrate-binding protein